MSDLTIQVICVCASGLIFGMLTWAICKGHEKDADEILKDMDQDELFEKIIENDGEILHRYLERHGYIYNKE